MSTDLKCAPDVSTSELISGIVGDMQDLMHQQFQLLKHDVRNDLVKVRGAGLLLGAGAGLGLVGAILLTQTLVYLTQWLLPDWPLWACFALWGGVACLGGGALTFAGLHRFGAIRPQDEPGAAALKENVEWISHPK